MTDADQLFRICNFAVLPGWALLVFVPRWKWSAGLIAPILIPAGLAVLYIGLLVSQLGRLEGGFSTLAGVELLFENRFALLAGWIHYLAFDLFVGSWEVRDARRLGIPHWVVVPYLLLTFLLGPAGLLLYLLLRSVMRHTVPVDEEQGMQSPDPRD